MFWSASQINSDFDGDANWNNATNSTQWNTPGAYHSTDTDIPFYGKEEIFWDDPYQTGGITGMLQQAVANGATSLDFLVQAEENGSSVDGRIDMYSSNEVSADLRPSLNITYRMTNPYVASNPTGLLPVDGATLWNLSEPRPSGADEVNMTWTPPSSNQSGYILCFGGDDRMVRSVGCIDLQNSTQLSEGNFIWDAATTTLTLQEAEDTGDTWLYWRLLSLQVVVDDYLRFGEWSQVNKFRIPEDQGYDDGAGNHTINLSSGSIFSDTGLLPDAPDTYTVSSGLNTNFGGSTTLKLGASSSGDHEVFIDCLLYTSPSPRDS